MTKTIAMLLPSPSLNGANADRVKMLAKASTEELRAELAAALKLTAEHLVRLALVWAELERRGEDLSALKNGIGKYLPMIASGAVLAETVVAFAGEPLMLSRAAKLPVDQQLKAIEAGTVPSRPRVADSNGTQPARGVYERAHTNGKSSCTATIIKPEQMAAKASPKDVVEMCLSMINANCNPKEIALRLIPELDKIVKQKRKDAP